MSTLAIEKLRRDGGTQPRATIDPEIVEQYAEAYRAKASLPPPVAFYDGTDHWLADGFHRVEALGRIGARECVVDVRQGTLRDAVLYSCGANASHGLRRSRADTRRAIETLLRDREWGGRSDRWIADKCAVSPTTVGAVRLQVSNLDTCPPSGPAAREGRDGKTYSVPTRAPTNGASRVVYDGDPGPEDTPIDDCEELPEHIEKPVAVESEQRAPEPAKVIPISQAPDYSSDEWYTPREYIKAVREVLGAIDLDPASCEVAQRTVGATRYYTKANDARKKSWRGRTFLNPPYSQPLVSELVAKFIRAHEAGAIPAGIVLVNNATDTAWCQSLLSRFDACFTSGRIAFLREDGKPVPGTRQGQIFFYAGRDRAGFARIFSRFGAIVRAQTPPARAKPKSSAKRTKVRA